MTIEQITVTITDVDEDGRLLLSSEQPQAGTPLLANVDDPDGSVSGVTWTWAISSDRTNWDPIASSEITAAGSAATYVPDAADVGRYLRITADYTDPLGSADQVQRALPNAVRAAPGSNSAPVFPLSEMGQRSVPEETAANVNIGLPVIATDADSDLLTYSLSSPGGSDDAESFDIIALSGQLRTDAVLDFETKSSYMVVVTATDPSRETAEITVTITVTDVTEQNWNTPGTTNPGGGGGGGGGGIPFIGGGGPTPSVEDYGWNVTGDIDPLASRNGDATGLWGDEHTLRVGQNGDGANDGVFAYDRWSGDRLEDLEFEIDETNRAPRGVWSDGETMWVSDSGQERIFAYDLDSGERVEDAEFALSSRNADARGIWSDGTSMWVLDGVRGVLFRYDLASGQSLGEFDLDNANGDPHGIWSDGTAIWVSDAGARKIFAYHQRGQGLMRESDEDFDGLMGAGNNSPRGIWSDGDLMYVVDAYDAKVYSYNMPDAFDARLASLSLSDVDIGDFSGLKTEYEGIPEDDATETTVAAVAVQDDATILIAPDDVDGNARDGHQVALDGTAVTVTVTSPDGSRTRVYRVQFEPADVAPASVADDPWETCLRGMTEGRFSLVAYEGGTIDDLRSCASQFELLAIWSDPDRVWVPIIFGAPDYVNARFVKLFPVAIPPVTPFVAQRNLPWPPPPVRETAEPDKTPDSTDAAPPQTEAPTPAGEESTPVIGNTGGDGVSHRYDCDDAARVAAIGGWSDGTEIEVLGEGRGRCAGWLLGEAEGVTSWVREQYVVGFTATPADPAQELSLEIGNTGGDGVSHRNECADEARLSAIWGWSDTTAVEVLADGLGRCAGWLWVEADADGVTSWVREEYAVEPTAVDDAPATDDTATDDTATDDTATDDTATDDTATNDTAADDTAADDTAAEVWLVIGNTGGEGVSHRSDCADAARLSEIGGWPDGTEVELLEEGSGRCAGWLRVQAGGVTSWVREEYVVESSGDTAATPGIRLVIGNTGGEGVSYRNECADDARLSENSGWPDGTEVELLEEGSKSCAGWLRVQADDVTSWVREEYVVESSGALSLPDTGRDE